MPSLDHKRRPGRKRRARLSLVSSPERQPDDNVTHQARTATFTRSDFRGAWRREGIYRQLLSRLWQYFLERRILGASRGYSRGACVLPVESSENSSFRVAGHTPTIPPLNSIAS